MTSESKAPVAAAADAILCQCGGFIESVDNDAFVADSQRIVGGTIGKHVRHCLDHFRALLTAGDEPVEYDHRDREVPVENDRAAAAAEVEALRAMIGGLSETQLDSAIRVRVMLSGDGTEATLESTMARELFFATHHAIHHHAMMKSIAGEFGCACEAGFGKAPSTLNYLDAAGA